MKTRGDKLTPLWLFYLYTLRRSIGSIVAMLLVPAALAVAMSYSISLLNDPKVIPIAEPVLYKIPEYLQGYDVYIETLKDVDFAEDFCNVLDAKMQIPCFVVDAFQPLLYKPGSFAYLATSLQSDFDDYLDFSEFLKYETEYKSYFNYVDSLPNGRRNAPLFYISFDVYGTHIEYKVAVNDELITESHRGKAMQYEIGLSNFDSSMYFSTIGTHLQNEIESYLVDHYLRTVSNITAEGNDRMQYKIAPLPTSSTTKQYYWYISYFAVFGPQAFSIVLIGLFMFKFRYFWLLKRMKINDLTFWGWMFVTGVISCYATQMFFAGVCYLCNVLPYSAYDFGALSVVLFLPSFAISGFVCLLIVCFENQQTFTITTTALALAFSVFPILLSIFISIPKSIWDDSFAPKAISYIFTVLSPVFMHYAMTELLLFTIDFRDLQSYSKYDKPLFNINYLFNTPWHEHQFYCVMHAGTYTMPGIWYYFAWLLFQACALFCITVYVSYCKKEAKQFGLPKKFLFSKRFWRTQPREPSLTGEVLCVEGLQKSFSKTRVVENFSIHLQQNSICGIIGATGAGKTTVLNMLAGYTDIDQAENVRYELLGQNLADPYVRLQMLDRIAICPQDKINMFDLLTIYENIAIFRSWNDISDEIVQQFLYLLNLENAVNKTFRQLSGGMQRRFALLISLLYRPAVLLLDEMTANVDPLLKRNIWDAISKYFSIQNCCIILTSHDSNDINNIATQVAFLDHGAIVKQGNVGEFIYQVSGMKLVLTNSLKATALKLLKDGKWEHFVNWDQRQCEIFVGVSGNERFAQLATLLDERIGAANYTLVSYPINEVFYKSYQSDLGEWDEETLPTTEQTVKLANERVLLLEEEDATHMSRLYQTNAYMSSALLSKFFEAKQSKFFVLLFSLATIIFFAVLEKVILDNVQQNPDRVSLYYYQGMREYSFYVFRRACVQNEAPIERQVFDCITSRREELFRKNTALRGPSIEYMTSPQHYLDIVGFDNMEDYHFVFGHNSLALSDYGDNYHAYVLQDYSEPLRSYQFELPNDGYYIGRDSFSLRLTDSAISTVFEQQKGLLKYLDRRFVDAKTYLVSRANFAAVDNLQALFNGYVGMQNHNNLEKSISSYSDSELLALEFSSFVGVIDPVYKTLYMQLPYYQLGKYYANTDLVLADAKIGHYQHFRHNAPEFGGPWFADIDPVYPVNYANDLLSKAYTAELRLQLAETGMPKQEIYNDVYLKGEFASMPKFWNSHIYQSEYAAENSVLFFSFMYFVPWIYCLLSIIALLHIHKYVDQFTLSFVNGMSISIFKYILSKVLMEMAAYAVKIYFLYLVMWIVKPADSYLMPMLWIYPLLYSLSIVCFLFFLELLLSNYSVACLYLGAVTIVVVLVNPVMYPTLPFALAGSLFIPGFFYVVAARMSALFEPFSKWWLVWGVLVQFAELFVLVLVKYLKTIRNSMQIKRDASCKSILQAENVTAYYSKDAPILTNFNLEIPRGQTLCLAGANGCGKSTFTKCLTGYQVHCDGNIVVNERIGIVPQDDCFDRNLTVLQNLKRFTCFSGLSAERLCDRVGLGEFRNDRAGSLSAGLARILTISSVLATNPKLLILDEVTVGLDFAMKKQVWKAILAQDCSILIITHDMLEIEALCDQVCIMQDGKVVSYESLANTLKKANTGYILTMYGSAVPNPSTQHEGFALKCFDQTQSARDVASWIAANNVNYKSWNLEKISMESVFLHIIGHK